MQPETLFAMSEDEVWHNNAAVQIQKVVRGHAARGSAVKLPIWPLNPCPIKGVLGFEYYSGRDLPKIFKSVDFKDQISRLERFLQGDFHLQDRNRLVELWHLLQFAAGLACTYSNNCLPSPASFLWSAVIKLCSAYSIQSTRHGDPFERGIFRSTEILKMHALSNQAHEMLKSGKIRESLLDLMQALKLCKQGEIVLNSTLKCQHAILLTCSGRTEQAIQLFNAIIQDLRSYRDRPRYSIKRNESPNIAQPSFLYDTQVPIGTVANVGVLDERRICDHLLILCHHNMAVACFFAGKIVDFKQASCTALAMLGFIHSAQPVSRHILHAYVSSLTMTAQKQQSTLAREMLSPTESQVNQVELPENVDNPQPWKKWLALVSDCVSLAPVWITLSELVEFNKRGDAQHLKNLDESLSLLLACFQEAKSSMDCVDSARAQLRRAELPLQDLCCNDWIEAAYVLDAISTFFFRCNAFLIAKEKAIFAINICREGCFKSIFQLQLSACQFRLHEHNESFNLAKEVLLSCSQNTNIEKKTVRNVLVAACQIMSLTHIFEGQNDSAVRCAQLAMDNLESSDFADKMNIEHSLTVRCFQIALSMNQLSKCSHDSVAPRKTELHSIRLSKSKYDPTNFVPSILLRTSLDLEMRRDVVFSNSSIHKKKYLWTGKHSCVQSSKKSFGEAQGMGNCAPIRNPEDSMAEFHGDFTRTEHSHCGLRSVTGASRINLNQLRCSNHLPLSKVLKDSKVGMFVSSYQRRNLTKGMEALLAAAGNGVTRKSSAAE